MSIDLNKESNVKNKLFCTLLSLEHVPPPKKNNIGSSKSHIDCYRQDIGFVRLGNLGHLHPHPPRIENDQIICKTGGILTNINSFFRIPWRV